MFIVIEGLDGSGGETQTEKLIEFLKSKGKDVVVLSYPNPDSPVGKLLYDYLDKKFDLPVDVQMFLYEVDMALDKEMIGKALEEGKIIVANRYLQSTLAYQCGAKGVPKRDALTVAETLGLHVPDLVIYLDISVDTSMKRKFGEHNKLDRHEEDGVLLEKVKNTYGELAKESVFSKEWVIVDGEKNIDEVSEKVIEAVSGKI